MSLERCEYVLDKPTDGEKYVYMNVNPQNQFTNDCLIRAAALVLSATWNSVYIEIDNIHYIYKVVDDAEFTDKYFMSKYFNRLKLTKKSERGTNYGCTALEWADAHPKGRYYLEVRAGYGTHAIACVDGVLYDTWDSYNKKILRVYEPKKNI